MTRIGIAGGIGAGKTTATAYLEELGYRVIDADEVARRVVEPGAPAWRALRDGFGNAVLRPDTTLDREFLAEVVFHDSAALRRLNQITHSQIGHVIVEELARASAQVIFVALPLFRPEHRTVFGLEQVWAIQSSPEVSLSRLVEFRGFKEADARARLATQLSNDERAAIVDHVIWNDGTIEHLRDELDTQLAVTGLVGG